MNKDDWPADEHTPREKKSHKLMVNVSTISKILNIFKSKPTTLPTCPKCGENLPDDIAECVVCGYRRQST